MAFPNLARVLQRPCSSIAATVAVHESKATTARYPVAKLAFTRPDLHLGIDCNRGRCIMATGAPIQVTAMEGQPGACLTRAVHCHMPVHQFLHIKVGPMLYSERMRRSQATNTPLHLRHQMPGIQRCQCCGSLPAP
jgi:hypothetical protein